MAEDLELQAIGKIIDLLSPLDDESRRRVLEYVLKRLDMSALHSAPITTSDVGVSPPSAYPPSKFKDIRTLTAEKQPRSANDMVALIAYYLSEIASESESSATVNVETIRKYFKMAGFPMPRVPKNALTNATAAGYLENVSRGEYRLNPVGYNLVVHGLPRSNASGPASKPHRRR